MRPKALKSFLISAINANLPVCITGRPGIGKTDITMQAVTECIYKSDMLPFNSLVLHPTVDDPIDYKGLPAIIKQGNGDIADFLPYGNLRAMMEADRPLVVFFDDLGQAPESIQKALMQLLLSRSINGKQISPHVRFVAATNRKEDKAGVSGLLEPVKSRFASIVELDVSLDDWIEWAFLHAIHANVIAFIKFAAHHFGEYKPTKDMTNSVTPRTLSHLSRWVHMQLPEICRFDAYYGAIGHAASEYEAFERMADSLVPAEEIIKDPKRSPLPDRHAPDVCYATVMSLATVASAENINAIVTFIDRFEPAGLVEFGMLCMRGIYNKKDGREICSNSGAWTTWAAKHHDFIR